MNSQHSCLPLTSTELIFIECATFLGRYFRMMLSIEMSLMPNIERRLATMRPFPEPGPPTSNSIAIYLAMQATTTGGRCRCRGWCLAGGTGLPSTTTILVRGGGWNLTLLPMFTGMTGGGCTTDCRRFGTSAGPSLTAEELLWLQPIATSRRSTFVLFGDRSLDLVAMDFPRCTWAPAAPIYFSVIHVWISSEYWTRRGKEKNKGWCLYPSQSLLPIYRHSPVVEGLMWFILFLLH